MDIASIPRLTCEFVEATEVVPPAWGNWFWSLLSDNSDFAWPGNNRSLVTACDFLDVVERMLVGSEEVDQVEIDQFLQALRELGATYIDLES